MITDPKEISKIMDSIHENVNLQLLHDRLAVTKDMTLLLAMVMSNLEPIFSNPINTHNDKQKQMTYKLLARYGIHD